MHYLLKLIEYFLPSSLVLHWPQFSREALDICQHLIVQLGACQAKELNQLGGHLKPKHVSSIDKAWSCWPPSSWPVPRAKPSRRCDRHLSITFIIPHILPHRTWQAETQNTSRVRCFQMLCSTSLQPGVGLQKFHRFWAIHSSTSIELSCLSCHVKHVDYHMMYYSTYTAEFLCHLVLLQKKLCINTSSDPDNGFVMTAAMPFLHEYSSKQQECSRD